MCTFVPDTFIGINFHEIILSREKAKISNLLAIWQFFTLSFVTIAPGYLCDCIIIADHLLPWFFHIMASTKRISLSYCERPSEEQVVIMQVGYRTRE